MKGTVSWSYSPYTPPMFDSGEIYICRIAPSYDNITIFLPKAVGECTVYCREKSEKDYTARASGCGNLFVLSDLKRDTDYEFYVASGEKRSRVRLARTGETVGTVVNYVHPKDDQYAFSGRYLCSPSLLRHPDGFLLASMDVYEHKAPQNLTLIFRSDDNGQTWDYISELFPSFWGKMFICQGKLYMLSCSTEYGDLLIGASEDGGKTFGTPTVLLRGSCKCDVPGVHKNPQPVIEYKGRVWATLEWGAWARGFHAPMVASAPIDADLLNPASWCFTPPLPYDPNWEGVAEGPSTGCIEGCLVVAPNGELYNVMRYDMHKCTPNFGRVLAFHVNTENPEAPLEYDHAINFPGNHSKFMIKLDKVSGYYVSIVNYIRDSQCKSDRNLLSLLYSKDMKDWFVAQHIIDYTDFDPKTVGFQYVDFLIEENDIVFLCRTAMNGANNFHDSNYITFHRIKDFRKFLI